MLKRLRYTLCSKAPATRASAHLSPEEHAHTLRMNEVVEAHRHVEGPSGAPQGGKHAQNEAANVFKKKPGKLSILTYHFTLYVQGGY